MRIGFTGTQTGMTSKQLSVVTKLLEEVSVTEAHHGDCVGADTDFHNLCKELQKTKTFRIIIHPPLKKIKRAFNKGADQVFPPKEHLDRNWDIVGSTEMLIATPKEYIEVLRSGTWATIRRARILGKSVRIVYPSGTMQYFIGNRGSE